MTLVIPFAVSCRHRSRSADFACDKFLKEQTVPSKKRRSKFKVGTEARRRARLGIGLPPLERAIIEQRFKKPKHKKNTKELLAESDE